MEKFKGITLKKDPNLEARKGTPGGQERKVRKKPEMTTASLSYV